LIAARMFMNPPAEIYNNRREGTGRTANAKVTRLLPGPCRPNPR
jgi:hypothetical protein